MHKYNIPVLNCQGTIEKGVHLRQYYTNEDEQMVCQLCENEMPFRKRNGEYYFEAVEALSRDHFTREHEAQSLALCPLCAALYTEFVKRDDEAMEALKQVLLDSDEPEIDLELGDRNSKLRFVEKHFDDIKTILSHKE